MSGLSAFNSLMEQGIASITFHSTAFDETYVGGNERCIGQGNYRRKESKKTPVVALVGVYHHVSRGHLGRYCDEFAVRYENRKASDSDRTKLLVAGAEGRRLTYKQPA